MYPVESVVDSGPYSVCARGPQAWVGRCAEGSFRESCTPGQGPHLEVLLPATIGWQCLPGLGCNQMRRAAALRSSRQEFVRGRQAAYAALCSVGLVDGSTCPTESFLTNLIGKNADRSPRWPIGFVGSISHSRNWVVAAAARERDFASIGIDSEPFATADQAAQLKLDIGHPTEWHLLETMRLPLPTIFTLLFSAKEAFYKCWYPLQKRFLDFSDVTAHRVRFEQNQPSEHIAVGEIGLALNGPVRWEMNVRFGITTQDVFTIATVSNGFEHVE